jgi:Predicted ATPase of the ABC class
VAGGIFLKNSRQLQQSLHALDGRGYAAYKALKGSYQFENFQLSVDHVQVDPFAPPSRARIIITRQAAGFPDKLLDSRSKRVAVSDYLSRTFWNEIRQRHHGSRNSGILTIDHGGQEILERTSVVIKKDQIEVRFEIGLPAAGRRILAKKADHLLSQTLPEIVDRALIFRNLDNKALNNQVALTLDQEAIRHSLKQKGLVAFIADGAMLPRESSISGKLLPDGVPFKSPVRFETEMTPPSGKTVIGMGIPEGVTLIVGGGYHGKSTLLKAIESGVYNHIPGDGRELVITRMDAVKIRAEDGRSIEKVNISPFISNLPDNRDTRAFSTRNASGSTSQAANVMEAMETGTSLLLIDEDTSATNFMIRDGRMQKLVSGDKEPITPFIDKVRALYREKGVSTVLIVGGSGDYFDVADQIIMMDDYVPKDVTARARQIARTDRYKRENASDRRFGEVTNRTPLRESFNLHGKKDRLKPRGRSNILYGKENIDLSRLEQLVDDSQTHAIAVMIDFLRKKMLDNRLTLSQTADKLYKQIDQFGLESLSPYSGHLALPRKQEFCAALNRYRGLKIQISE